MPEAIAILGQGLAGTLLSFRLAELGIDHIVIDPGHTGSATVAAAGLVNPVTGRHFVLVPRYRAALATFDVYARLAARLGRTLVQPLTIYRDLSSVEALNRWDLRRLDPAYAQYLGPPMRLAELNIGSATDSAAMVGPTRGAWRVDLPGLVGAWQTCLIEAGRLSQRAVTGDDLALDAAWPQVFGREFIAVVDARGAASAKTGHWDAEAWRLTKGEALVFRDAGWSRDAATKLGGHFLVPLGTADGVWFGGTTDDRYSDDAPDPATLDRLLAEVTRLGRSVLAPDHRAAIRPTMRDRRWVVKPHVRQPRFVLLNGLGTRGALDAPSAVEACLSMLGVA